MAIAPGVRASPLPYVLTSNASVVLDGYTEALSGSFTFDTTDDEESGVSIDLTGLAPFSGTYTQGTAVTVGVDNNVNAQGPAGGILFLNFSDALNTGPRTVDELSSAYLSSPLDVDCFALCSATSLVGGASAVMFTFTSNASVVLDGYAEALSGTYTQGTAVTVGVENNINAQGPAGGILFLNFSDALNTGPGTVDELSSAYLSSPLDVDCFALCSATSLVGGAGDPPPSGVPEPTSLAPLGSALAILALLRWRRRSGAVSQPARTRQA